MALRLWRALFLGPKTEEAAKMRNTLRLVFTDEGVIRGCRAEGAFAAVSVVGYANRN